MLDQVQTALISETTSTFRLTDIPFFLTITVDTLLLVSFVLMMVYLFSCVRGHRGTAFYEHLKRVMTYCLLLILILFIINILLTHSGCNTTFYQPQVTGNVTLLKLKKTKDNQSMIKANFIPNDRADFIMANHPSDHLYFWAHLLYLKIKYSALVKGSFVTHTKGHHIQLICQIPNDKIQRATLIHPSSTHAATLIFNGRCFDSFPPPPEIEIKFTSKQMKSSLSNCRVMIKNKKNSF